MIWCATVYGYGQVRFHVHLCSYVIVSVNYRTGLFVLPYVWPAYVFCIFMDYCINIIIVYDICMCYMKVGSYVYICMMYNLCFKLCFTYV